MGGLEIMRYDGNIALDGITGFDGNLLYQSVWFTVHKEIVKGC
jgi:hypothetical protein